MLTYALRHPLRATLRRSLLAIALSLSLCSSIPRALAADLTRLSDEAIAAQLTTLPGWTLDGSSLVCTYQFNTFVEAVAFVNRMVAPAEAAGHHPDLTLRYNRVTVHLTTHDAGGLTQQDFDLAQAIVAISGDVGEERRGCATE